MTRPLVVLAATAAVAVAVLPAAATAKEVEKATVCGADGCQTNDDNHAVAVAVENGGPPTSPPAHRARFYRVAVHIRGDSGHPFRLLVVPSARRVRADGNAWFEMDRFSYRAWRRVLHGVKPFPATKLPLTVSQPPPGAGQLPPQTYAPALQRSPATDTGDGTDWGLISGIATGSLVLLVAATRFLTRRRRRGGGAQAAPVS